MSIEHPRVAVIGGGIAGLAATHALATNGAVDVTLFERSGRAGGRISGGSFAGLDHVDSGADAFLARVPHAHDLAVAVGLADDLVHPEPVGAAVWFNGLRDIPAGLVLGVPSNPLSLARSRLLSVRGMARAAIEPLLPRSDVSHDSIGRHVRARFGHEVHERLVDALVGSIYAADTDHFSLSEIPQLAALTSDRSMLLAARKVARRTAGTASAKAAPIFATPRGGIAALASATAASIRAAGGTLELGREPVLAADGHRWRVDDDAFAAVVLATPAAASAALLAALDAPASDDLRTAGTSDVVMITMHIAESEFPERLRGRSGYLVPKPVQRDVTAVSFGSEKWAHWRPPSGGHIVRVSLGRDGAPVLHHTDDELVQRALDDLARHLGVSWTPREIRLTRWPAAFAQYRPHHRAWVDQVRSAMPSGLFLAGSSYDGIGIPACISSGKTIGEQAANHARSLAK